MSDEVKRPWTSFGNFDDPKSCDCDSCDNNDCDCAEDSCQCESEKITFEQWVKIGYENKWISEPVCETHDGLPMTPEELDAWDEGGDPCVHALRLFSSAQEFDKAIKESE